jgi:hypothetical protein
MPNGLFLIRFFALTLACISAINPAELPLAASDKYRLVWNDDPTTTITIAWDQAKIGGNPVICYDIKDRGRNFVKYRYSKKSDRISLKYGMNTHFAKLTGLKPGKAYYFVFKDDQGVSERYWFRTAPSRPESFTFIEGGDTKSEGNPLEAGRNTNRVVACLRPLFVYYNGDFISGDGTNPEWWKQWLTDWHKMTTTDDNRMVPIVPIHGNHENGDKGNLYHIFNAPYHNGDSSKIYYSLSFGGNFFHMVQLNTEIEEGGQQREWLKNDLEKHRDFTFKIAGYHKPFFPHTKTKADNPNQYRQWAWLFYENRLSVSFDADSHMAKITYPIVPDSTSDGFSGYKRDDINGTIFTGEGSWGAAPRANNNDKPWTLTSASFNHIKWIHVYPGSKNEEAHMRIYTIPTANYDLNDNLVLMNTGLTPVSEENLMGVPHNLNLHKPGSTVDFVRFPFKN